jgi:hypothetical protein
MSIIHQRGQLIKLRAGANAGEGDARRMKEFHVFDSSRS